ncbi:DedA family protein [Bradyrhizobium sp. U87765 SZCCT0131]|uniref:DedA family protein n=1 Tax=unclassified Bradyrhizobium TaxID=2631580 RepID=UPI001BA871C7|nr:MULTISPECIES: DedA family protein [unclassified Bradyrhizobium]MBR1216619.1 DedA family protein [Bradyrhizobium sp. U87765 SZCCT0131]MBR1259625.1 DedA family protein [Bradyrhizobium sp. U87765 SZCCT0134]MBR1305766.1 DedA family protein [Bradyrhizobium sp. U87765 SZCCT0110]MBR1322133.1 DedA family protein [Bradyrhizobium sp. U87765 SZCCT0109]MBR1350589.1 DedA family protein [Bradyrhizobium sp. U87765 SZCCT0048]
MEIGTADLIAFIKAHESWIVPLAFVFAFIKALAFVSLIVPGTAILLAIGAMVGASKLAVVPIWLAISIGAALGDWVSYEIGHRFDRAATSMWPLSRHPDLIPRAEAFFRRWGALSIVGCRFFGPLRATVPLVAGIFHMPCMSFQVANWLSAFLWAGTLLLPGAVLFR